MKPAKSANSTVTTVRRLSGGTASLVASWRVRALIAASTTSSGTSPRSDSCAAMACSSAVRSSVTGAVPGPVPARGIGSPLPDNRGGQRTFDVPVGWVGASLP